MNAPKSTLAVLRRIIGIGQKEMADLVGCSFPTIQAIEYRKLELSERLGEQISIQTGIDVKWLLDGDTSKPPIDTYFGVAFTRQTFEETRAAKRQAPDSSLAYPRLSVDLSLVCFIQRTCAILAKASKNGKERLCEYKMESFLDDLEKEFGADEAIESQRYFIVRKGEGVPEIPDVAPIIASFYARLRQQATPTPTKRAGGQSKLFPKNPAGDDYRLLIPGGNTENLDIVGRSFRRKDLFDGRLLGETSSASTMVEKSADCTPASDGRALPAASRGEKSEYCASGHGLVGGGSAPKKPKRRK